MTDVVVCVVNDDACFPLVVMCDSSIIMYICLCLFVYLTIVTIWFMFLSALADRQ